MNQEVITPQAQIDPALVQEFTPGVYGSGNAYGLEASAISLDMEVNVVRSTEVARATGAAMLDASSYADPSARGVLYAQYAAEGAHAAASTEDAVRASIDSIFDKKKSDELVDA
jgi:hypothetical protein